jgi:hypothetical protein
MLEKMELVEAKLMQLRHQGSFPGATSGDASRTGGKVDSAKNTARVFAMKAVDVAKEAVLFCTRFDDGYCRLKPRRVQEH